MLEDLKKVPATRIGSGHTDEQYRAYVEPNMETAPRRRAADHGASIDDPPLRPGVALVRR